MQIVQPKLHKIIAKKKGEFPPTMGSSDWTVGLTVSETCVAEGNQHCRLPNNIEKAVGKARLNKEKNTAVCRVFFRRGIRG